MNDLDALSPQQVAAELALTATEIGEALRSTDQHHLAAAEHLEELGRPVYRHDTWTCPASVAHALAEVYRHFANSERALESFVLSVYYLLDVETPSEVARGFDKLNRPQANALAPLTPIEQYFDHISNYLDSHSDSLFTQARRQWRPKKGEDTRISFAHNQFSAKSLTRKCASKPPRRGVTLYRYHHRLAERSVQRLTALATEFQQQYMLLMRLSTKQADHASMTDDHVKNMLYFCPDTKQAFRSSVSDGLVQHTSRFRKYIWDQLLPSIYRRFDRSQMYTGWHVPYVFGKGLSVTVEDALGAFSSWATPDRV